MNGELKKIKKLYGEKFAQMCRDFFPVLLGTPGQLSSILEKYFSPTHYLYDDLVENDDLENFKEFIYSIVHREEEVLSTDETPEELMDKAGYILYKCESDEDVKSFKKYYAPGEEICTFRDKERINNHTIFFAVKKDVDDIKREDFTKPKRQDRYGTSVISLQFSKKNGYLSIKNRYNHKVPNCDATFSNDLENIYPGLTDSFRKYYDLKFKAQEHKLELEGYAIDINGKYYKMNFEANAYCFCEGNYIIDQNGEVKYFDKFRYDIIDNFIIDKSQKNIMYFASKDSLVDNLKNIKNIVVLNIKDGKRYIFYKENGDEIIIETNKNNNITAYYDETLKEIKDDFLLQNTDLKELYVPNVEKIGDNFLYYNSDLKELWLPKVEQIGNNCLSNNEIIDKVDLPKVKNVGKEFLKDAESLRYLKMPLIEEFKCKSFEKLEYVKEFNFPNLITIGDSVFRNVGGLRIIELPNVRKIGNNCFESCVGLEEMYLPEVETIGDSFLITNYFIKILHVPNLKQAGRYLLMYDQGLEILDVPSTATFGSGSLMRHGNIVLPENKEK